MIFLCHIYLELVGKVPVKITRVYTQHLERPHCPKMEGCHRLRASKEGIVFWKLNEQNVHKMDKTSIRSKVCLEKYE